MTSYVAPLQEMRFALSEFAGLADLAALPGFEDATPDLVDAVLEEAAKLTGNVIAPLNAVGDRYPSALENGVVRTPEGFREAYAQYRDGGWNSIPFTPNHGGQGLPWSVAMAVMEQINAANMSFGLCPTLNVGAVEAIEAHCTEDQKALYLPKLISGEWTGTMNLTEPQAGSDVGAIRTKAERQEDGSYRITGQKIYITYGDHDLADNIIHLVLARLPDAPKGTKGISLFLVPKFILDESGAPGQRNDVRCVSLEHKLGIHASPTAVMAYGDNEGAEGWLVGEENRGMACMFTMMNNARLSVGLQGVAIGERAYQQARDYALSRVQSGAVTKPGEGPVAIVNHPDVRRMLLSMRSQVEAGRALTYLAVGALDRSKRHIDEQERQRASTLVDLLTPMVKAWCTDMGVEVASLGVQVHGGMGFIEETGAAQHYRDARIAPIYEGTNGIQANDLVFRKVLRDDGKAATSLIGEMQETASQLIGLKDADLSLIGQRLTNALADLNEATDWLLDKGANNPVAAASAASPYLKLFAIVAAGWLMARAAEATANDPNNPDFAAAKRVTARFFADQILPQTVALTPAILGGTETVMALSAEQF
ncbi:MAG: acyl-CoA dehydrogenase [Pseudomonadota bacterium]